MKNSLMRKLVAESLEPRMLLSADPGVIPVHANAFGTSYGELAGEWWNWAFKNPATTSPLLDETGEHCAENQSGKVWFLAGNFGGESTRECEVPTGKALFFPVLNNVWFPDTPGVPEDEGELRELANEDMDAVDELSASVDGQEIDVWNYRAESPPGGFTLTVEPGSLLTDFGLDFGEYSPAVADGYWLLLAPLSKGSHEVSFSGKNPSFELNVTYDLTVVSGKKAKDFAVAPPVVGTTGGLDKDTSVRGIESIDKALGDFDFGVAPSSTGSEDVSEADNDSDTRRPDTAQPNSRSLAKEVGKLVDDALLSVLIVG